MSLQIFFIFFTTTLLSINSASSKTISNIFNTDNFPNYKLDIKTGPSDTDITFQHTAESKVTQLNPTNKKTQEEEEEQITTSIQGKYLIKTDEGILTVKYIADENGYRPKVYWYASATNNNAISKTATISPPPKPQEPTKVGYSSPVGPGAPKSGQTGGIGSAVLATLCGRSKCTGR